MSASGIWRCYLTLNSTEKMLSVITALANLPHRLEDKIQQILYPIVPTTVQVLNTY